MTPQVSIIMPCYNSVKHLARSVPSVQRQTFQEWELIIVDDGSTDDSWERMSKLASKDSRITPVRQSNAGAAAARNKGLDHAQGRYTAFLDADDTWHPAFLAHMTAALDKEKTPAIAYCGWQNIGHKKNTEPFIPPEYENDHKIESLLESCRWPIHAALTPTRIIQDAGGFDETLTSCMDYDLWLRLGVVHKLVRVPKVLSYYHHHGEGQITRNLARIALNHFRVQRKFIKNNPEIINTLGKKIVRKISLGYLLHRGFEAYWQRDLEAARKIFRTVMKHGYGRPKDWLYMLPSLLPFAIHNKLIHYADLK